MTVIAGGSRCNSQYFAWHLQRTDKGQTVEVRDVEGLLGDDMAGWFEQMEALALGSRAKNVFYHFSLSPREGEAFSDEQVRVGIATALRNLGLEDQPYFVVQHGGKDGRPDHFHCIVSRIDLDTGKAISDSRNYDIHMRTADELEELFGHSHTERGRGPEGPNAKNYEVQRGDEAKMPVKQVQAELTDLWQRADSPQAFAAAVAENGYILCEGRRGLCVVDKAAKEHSLYSRLKLKKKELDPQLEAVREALPSVGQARAMVRARRDEDQEHRDDAKHQPDKKSRDAALDMLAKEIAEAVRDALKAERQESARDHAPDEEPFPGDARKETGPEPPHDSASEERSAPDPSHEPEPEKRHNKPVNYGLGEERGPSPRSAPHEPTTIRRSGPSAFERLAGLLSRGLQAFDSGPGVAEAADLGAPGDRPAETAPALPWEDFASPAPASVPSAFERLATGFAQEASATGPWTEQAAAVAAADTEPALSEFERVTQAHHAALGGGEAASFTEGLAWLADKLPPSDGPPPDRALTPFESVTQAIHEATRENGGAPEPGFWQRSVALLAAARDSIVEWAREAARGFVDRIRGERERERPDQNNNRGLDR